MKAIHYQNPGNPEVLKFIDIDKPKPKIRQVLIEVRAAGVNRPDLLQREGNYPAPKGHSIILGLEVSGIIVSVGAGVLDFKIGDRVCALVDGGGYAEFCVANEEQIIKISDKIDFVEASGIPECFFTCWANIFEIGKLKKNQKVLIHGGGSGIGTTAIQMLKLFDVESYVTVGSDKKKKLCEKLGAKMSINHKKEDFFVIFKNFLKYQGFNLILDMIGGDYVQKNIDLLENNGKLVNIAYQKGSKVEVNMIKVMLKRLIITGSTLRIRNLSFKKKIRNRLIKNIVPFIENGKIKPIVSEVFKLKDAAKAHKRMYESNHFGKIILKI